MKPRTIGQNLTTTPDIARALNELSHAIDQVLRNGVTFEDNFDGVSFSHQFSGVASAESITHGLKRVPTKFLIDYIDKAAVVYASGTWTDSTVYLRCTITGTSITGKLF